MHKLFVILLAGVALAGLTVDAAARGWGHHRHGSHFSLHFGSPYWWGPPAYYWPPPHYYYYYEPRTVIIERQPPVYIQRPAEVVAPAPAATVQAPAPPVWYYCTEPAGYYPHVQNCTRPWVSVDPRTVAPPAVQ